MRTAAQTDFIGAEKVRMVDSEHTDAVSCACQREVNNDVTIYGQIYLCCLSVWSRLGQVSLTSSTVLAVQGAAGQLIVTAEGCMLDTQLGLGHLQKRFVKNKYLLKQFGILFLIIMIFYTK